MKHHIATLTMAPFIRPSPVAMPSPTVNSSTVSLYDARVALIEFRLFNSLATLENTTTIPTQALPSMSFIAEVFNFFKGIVSPAKNTFSFEMLNFCFNNPRINDKCNTTGPFPMLPDMFNTKEMSLCVLVV